MLQVLYGLIVKLVLTGGWKTYAAGVGMVLGAVGGLLQGTIDVETAYAGIMAGLAILGLGHKAAKIEAQLREGNEYPEL